MTHFVALVIGDNVEAQLQPYHEFECTDINDQYVIDVDKTAEAHKEYGSSEGYASFRAFLEGWYGAENIIGPGQEPDRAGEHKYGWVRVDARGEAVQYIDRTNPNRKWDWWQLGGRWCDYFLLKDGASGERGQIGLMGGGRRAAVLAEEREMQRVHADAARKGDIDWEGMAAERMRNADRDYSEFLAKVGGRAPGFEAYIFDVEMKPEARGRLDAIGDHEARRAAAQTLTLADYESRDEYMQRKARRAGITRVVVKDGEWMERGKAGWFGTFSDAMSEEEWDRRYWELLEALPSETMLTIVDCHI